MYIRVHFLYFFFKSIKWESGKKWIFSLSVRKMSGNSQGILIGTLGINPDLYQ